MTRPALNHIAIIMDGNGRWAQARGLPRSAGHQRGADAVKRCCEAAMGQGIRYLTLFGFSSENWARPQDEVTELMGLLRRYLQSETAELHDKGVRLRFIGDRRKFSPDIIKLMTQAESLTKGNDAMHLTIALNYGGRQEILQAMSRILFQSFQSMAADKGAADKGQAATQPIIPWNMDEKDFAGFLDTSDLPDPDLIIRTSGEKRLSNFLLWQSAYAELAFLDVLWPDFTAEDLQKAVDDYHGRERRFGKVRHG